MFPPPPTGQSFNPPPDWLHQYHAWTIAMAQHNAQSGVNNMHYLPPHFQHLAASMASGGLYNYAPSAIAETFHERIKAPNNVSCYNCGEQGHRGNECKKETLDDVTNQMRSNSKRS
jgi:hypothetical protein